MKNIIILVVLILVSGITYGQKNVDQVLRKYKNDEGVVSMNFSGESLKEFSNNSKKQIKSIVDNVDILLFDGKIDIDKADKAKIQSVLTRDKYDLLFDVKHKDGKVKVYATESGPHLTKLYAHVNTVGQNVHLILTGKIILEELSDLGLNFGEKADFDLFKKYSK